MPSLFQQIRAGQLWDFHGGIHPPTRKDQTRQRPIGQAVLPELLYVPTRQHIGVAGKVLVKPGERVLKGQALTAADNAMALPVHAPTSGTVESITSWPSAHPSALPEPVIVLRPDGLEQWRPRHQLDYLHTERTLLLSRIQQAGIAGMGGAGFPTHIKSGPGTGVDYLIINAVECEPYITADDVLMQHEASTIVRGIDILCKLLSPKAVLIGIEDDKTAAIAAMQQACIGKENYLVRVVPTKYPSGGEKQLIQLLTNKEVPTGRRPLDIGIVMQNVATAFAIAQAVEQDIPLISRIVTVVGETLSQPQNLHALIGTPVHDLLTQCGFQAEPGQRVIMGGPMMGFTLPSLHIPLVKTTNCLLAPSQSELPADGSEMDCIRCGACAEACPATLLPQQLLWYAKAKDHDQLKKHYLQDCIECGACSYVCPSEIPLVHYYRVAKAEIREQAREELKAEQARARFEARKERLEQEKAERAARNQALANQRNALLAEQQKQQIAQAAARVNSNATAEPVDKADIIAERERKKAEARAYQAAKAAAAAPAAADADEAITSEQTPATDARQAAVAAAIARAKAKKQQEQAAEAGAEASVAVVSETVAETAVDASADPRKAAVAAAIARAKAKKLAEQAAEPAAAPEAASSTADASDDPRKAAVAAAIARAKAKKLAEQAAEPAAAPEAASSAADASDDPRKAAIAAAIARAKAKKLAEQAAEPVAAPEAASSAADASADPRKAAVAAAIARAKAKKLAEQAAEPVATPSVAGDSTVTDHAAEITEHPAVATALPATELPNADRDAAKKAAIAAAIARAKARQQQGDPQ